MKTLSIVVPVFNEMATIADIPERLRLAPILGLTKDLIVVDDGSTDGTRAYPTALPETDGKFHERNLGKSAALRTGFGHATGDIVLRTFRRYTKRGLAATLQAAGFAIVALRYVNALGAFGWFIAGRVLRRRTLSPRLVSVADRTLVPVTAWLERHVEPAFGQSLIAVATKA